jgi:hypothetical protein
MGMLVIVTDWGGSRIKKTWMALSTGKILEENLVQFAFHQTLSDSITFQQDNNLTGVASQEDSGYS